MKVTLVWITKYYNPEHENHGKFCILMGKERFGENAGMYSLFESDAFDKRSDEFKVLFSLFENKLGLDLSRDLAYFMKSIIHKISTENNIYYICCMQQMHTEYWKRMMIQRVLHPNWKDIVWNDNEITQKYLSLENVKYFPISEIPTLLKEKVIAKPVEKAFEYIKDSLDYAQEISGCTYIAFIAKKPNIPMIEYRVGDEC